jgi:hypothetical protein
MLGDETLTLVSNLVNVFRTQLLSSGGWLSQLGLTYFEVGLHLYETYPWSKIHWFLARTPCSCSNKKQYSSIDYSQRDLPYDT